MRMRRQSGFTLIELVIVVAIIGILAAIAIPNFLRFQLKSKTSEAKINLAAVRVVEESYRSEWGSYVGAAQAPVPLPGGTKVAFVSANFDELGWGPSGDVFFSYAVSVTPDGTGLTVEAAADLDEDGLPQYWGFKKPNNAGAYQPSTIGCNIAALTDATIGPCGATMGQDIF